VAVTWALGITLGSSDVTADIDPDQNINDLASLVLGQSSESASISPQYGTDPVLRMILSNAVGSVADIYVSLDDRDVTLYYGFADDAQSGEAFILSLSSQLRTQAEGDYFVDIPQTGPCDNHWYFAYPLSENPGNIKIVEPFDDELNNPSQSGYVEVEASVDVGGTAYRLIRSIEPCLGPTKIRIF